MLCYASDNRCESCPPGQVHNATTRSCSTCPVGRASPDVNSPCADCDSGQYQPLNAAIAYNCAPCVAGQYTDLIKQAGCKSCIEGKYSTSVGKKSVATCSPCEIGKFGDAGGGQGTNCTSCIAGQYNELTTQLICKSCVEGTYSTGTKMVSIATCLPCETGRFGDAGGGQATACKLCIAGQYNELTTQLICKSCIEGRYSTGNEMVSVATCLPCETGRFGDAGGGQGTNCTSCVAGKYNNLKQQLLVVSCKSCIEATYSLGVGNPTCTPCETGRFGDAGGGQSVACKSCIAGKFNNLKQQSLVVSCKSCIEGRYSVGVGNPSCTNCTIGKLSVAGQDQIAESVCKVCAPGLYIDVTGSTTCKACAMGKNLMLEGTAAHHDSEKDCEKCPKQQFNPYPGRGTACLFCITAQISGESRCDGCDPGKYQEKIGIKDFCGNCPSGWYNDAQNLKDW